MGRVTVRRPITAVERGGAGTVMRVDTLAVEEPLELRVGGTAYVVTMRTPGHDMELVHGLLAAEGVVGAVEDVVTARYCAGAVVTGPDGLRENTYNVVDVVLADGVTVPEERRRATTMTSACGVCGSASIEMLRATARYDVRSDPVRLDPATVLALPDRLRQAQRTFDSTGGLHAAALFDASGHCLVVREDVGRHNAVDKVVGWALLNERRPGTGLVLVVSGRTSFELAQKAVLAGIPVLAGVSAPSSLAVEVAQEAGLTLCGFVRGDRMNVYSRPDRLVGV